MNANKLFETSVAKVRQAIQEQGLTFSDPAFEDAYVYTQAFRNLSQVRGNIGMAQLMAMWKMNNLYDFAGEYNEFMEYVHGELLDDEGVDRDEVLKWANVVDVILSWVVDNPVTIVNPEQGQEDLTVTVDFMLNTYGLTNKMRSSVRMFREADEIAHILRNSEPPSAVTGDEIRARIVEEIITGTQASIAQLNREFNIKQIEDTGITQVRCSKRYNTDGTVDMAFKGLTEQQAAFVEAALGDSLIVDNDTSEPITEGAVS